MAQTIGEFLESYLVENGLFEDEAHEVTKQYKASTHANMQQRWNDSIDGYSKPLLAVLLLSVRRIAVEWIDEHAPKHFARKMFV